MPDQKAANRRNPGHFGPRVIGEEEFQREQEMVEEGAHKYGPDVIDSHPVTDDEGEKIEPDRSESPRKTVGQPSPEEQVGQYDLAHKAGGYYTATHAATGDFVAPDGTLVEDVEEAETFPRGGSGGADRAKDDFRAFLAENQEPGEESREVFVDQEAGPQATDPTPHQPTEADQVVRERENEEGYLSLEDQTELLEEAGDALRDRIIDSEFGRADGARKQGLRNLIEAEKGREDGPRPRVLNRLERAFAQVTSTPD